ncbi:metal-dependent hydrolase [Sporosarcina sp. USHLN248]|uniref:metal-dependent hydrolase n=1 Tax=Sporosarcina sp. USHLN248 TaxID=3081300 RepID=UPI0030158F52
MKGSSHFVIGVVAGAAVGLQANYSLLTTAICAGIGGVSGLVPDLDTNGVASNRITVSKQISKTLMQIVGVCILFAIAYQAATDGFALNDCIYGGIALILLILSKKITQRRMLTLTGAMVILLGISWQQSIGIILSGSYIVIASFLPHRSYTHSIIGLAFYAFILVKLNEQWPVNGMVAAGIAGYISHLLADMKLLPMNRRGVKWFAPVWNREF